MLIGIHVLNLNSNYIYNTKKKKTTVKNVIFLKMKGFISSRTLRVTPRSGRRVTRRSCWHRYAYRQCD